MTSVSRSKTQSGSAVLCFCLSVWWVSSKCTQVWSAELHPTFPDPGQCVAAQETPMEINKPFRGDEHNSDHKEWTRALRWRWFLFQLSLKITAAPPTHIATPHWHYCNSPRIQITVTFNESWAALRNIDFNNNILQGEIKLYNNLQCPTRKSFILKVFQKQPEGMPGTFQAHKYFHFHPWLCPHISFCLNLGIVYGKLELKLLLQHVCKCVTPQTALTSVQQHFTAAAVAQTCDSCRLH